MLATQTEAGPEAFWNRLDAGARSPGWNGCYLMRTGSGPLRSEAGVAAALADYLAELQEGFRTVLQGRALTVSRKLAATQCVALLAWISKRGAADGAGPAVAPPIEAGRQTFGLAGKLG